MQSCEPSVNQFLWFGLERSFIRTINLKLNKHLIQGLPQHDSHIANLFKRQVYQNCRTKWLLPTTYLILVYTIRTIFKEHTYLMTSQLQTLYMFKANQKETDSCIYTHSKVSEVYAHTYYACTSHGLNNKQTKKNFSVHLCHTSCEPHAVQISSVNRYPLLKLKTKFKKTKQNKRQPHSN